jgi:hypothetical protein
MRHPPPGESAAGAAAVTIFGGPSTQKAPSVARVAAGAFGFLTSIQAFDFPEGYGAS